MRPACNSWRRVGSTSHLVLTAALVLAVAAAGRGEALLDVHATIVATTPRLEVRVMVANRGDRIAAPLEITGELLGERQETRLVRVAPGASESVVLGFAGGGIRPGVHALALLLEHPIEGASDGAGNPPMTSRHMALPVVIGREAEPVVRLAPRALQLDVADRLLVSVSSLDGRVHRVRLRALPPRGLRAEGSVVVEVPFQGMATAGLPLVRAGAQRASRHTVTVVAETVDGSLARTSVADAVVEIAPDPSLFRRLRRRVLASALLLLAVVMVGEAFRRRRRST